MSQIPAIRDRSQSEIVEMDIDEVPPPIEQGTLEERIQQQVQKIEDSMWCKIQSFSGITLLGFVVWAITDDCSVIPPVLMSIGAVGIMYAWIDAKIKIDRAEQPLQLQDHPV